jgi:PhnB protein
VQFFPHLSFNGQCEAAFKLYETCLRGQITMLMTHADSPMAAQVPPHWGQKIFHATLLFGGHRLSGADVLPEQYQRPQGFSLHLNVADVAEAERLFEALADRGTVQLPLAETFWALRFGMLVDPFGTPWAIQCSREA